MAKKDAPTSKNPDIKTTGNDTFSNSTVTVKGKKSTTTVEASYSAVVNDESPTKLNATITSTKSSKNTTTVDTTEVTGKIDADLGTMRFTEKQNITTTTQLANGGKREQVYSNDQSSSLVDPMSVAKGLRLDGSSNEYNFQQGTRDVTFDANGKMRYYEGHYTSPAGGHRSDEITSYDNKEQIREAMRAQFYDAGASFHHQKGTMEKAGDKDFSATLEKDGSISYRMGKNTTGNTITETVVNVDASGKVSGYTTETRKDVATNMWNEAKEADRKIKTAKELEKLRKKMQKRGDKIAKKISGQNMADYKQEKQSYAYVGGTEYFRKQAPEVEKAYQNANKTNQEIAGAVNDVFKQMTPQEVTESLVRQKLQEQKGK